MIRRDQMTAHTESVTPRATSRLKYFTLFSWLHMLSVTWPFFNADPPAGLDLVTVFNLAVWLSYSLLYLVPGLLPASLLRAAQQRESIVTVILAVAGTTACILLVRADSTIYDLYRFHFNGFVVNLLLTPGGMASLGGSAETYLGMIGVALAHTAVQLLMWFVAGIRVVHLRLPLRWTPILLAVGALAVGERLIHGYADLRNEARVLTQARTYPLYQRTTFRGMAKKLGVVPAARPETMVAEVSGNELAYPSSPIAFSAVEDPPNIVLLVAESLRWDRLTPEVMPHTWALAGQSLHFLNHYSSGNGTREGMFGLFYGLYGSYWSSFLHGRKGPLLMDRLQSLGYQFNLRTSARFSYPEFDQTLFARIPLANLHEASPESAPWQRDEDNASALISFFRERDPSRPFMGLLFLESTHARYDFPTDAAIAQPYLASVDYSSMTRESLRPQIDQLFNRYTNAAHWVDRQIGRIHEALQAEGLLGNTILIVTGDHGEEFMEKGFWGHNSSFVDEQVRTPLVIRLPGAGHRRISALTSHLDVPTTLLQRLGAPADATAYALGDNLLDLPPSRQVVTSDWQSIGLINSDFKYRIAYDNRGADGWLPTAADDGELPPSTARGLLEQHRSAILEVMRNTTRFTRRNTAAIPAERKNTVTALQPSARELTVLTTGG